MKSRSLSYLSLARARASRRRSDCWGSDEYNTSTSKRGDAQGRTELLRILAAGRKRPEGRAPAPWESWCEKEEETGEGYQRERKAVIRKLEANSW
jgi:hypothetical protein